MTKFQLGDKVIQSEQSRFRHGTASNPIGVVGEVIEIREPDSSLFRYRVRWPSGTANAYNETDLELAEGTFDVIEGAKRLHTLRAQAATLNAEVSELEEKVRKALEGTGLTLIEDAAKPTQTLKDMLDNVQRGDLFQCVVSSDTTEHLVGKVYAVVDLDEGDSMPVKLQSEDGYGWWIAEEYLQNYIKV